MRINELTQEGPTRRIPYARLVTLCAVGGSLGLTWVAWKYFDLTSRLFGGLSFVIGGLGLIVSVVGFWYTIVQLKRTRTSTEAVQAAVGNLKVRVDIIDISFETQRAIKLLETTLVHLQHESWVNASSSLWEAQNATYRLRDRFQKSNDEGQVVKNAIVEFLLHVQTLDDLAKKRVKNFDTSEMRLMIRSLVNVLNNAAVSAQKDLYDA